MSLPWPCQPPPSRLGVNVRQQARGPCQLCPVECRAGLLCAATSRPSRGPAQGPSFTQKGRSIETPLWSITSKFTRLGVHGIEPYLCS